MQSGRQQVIGCLSTIHHEHAFKLGRPGENVFNAWDDDIYLEVYSENEDSWIMGIDPKSCWDSIKRASIKAYFPMSKREFNRFMRFMQNKICDKRSQWRKEWLREIASTSFYGETAEFGR